MIDTQIQYLLSLPAKMASSFEELENKTRPEWFATSDPAGSKLGSGGGTSHLLVEAWKHTSKGQRFQQWLGASRKLMIHGGGQSRRLPAYSVTGKLLMPIPAFRWSVGQRLDQTLLDLQLPDYQRVLNHAGPHFKAMVASGDVFLRFGKDLPELPEVDVLGLGMWVTAEKARDFGVFFCPRERPGELAFFLQKPEPSRTRDLSTDYFYLVDTGMWLLSERAVLTLLKKCGWDESLQDFARKVPDFYELYSHFGLGLGTSPVLKDPDINALTCAAIPLPQAQFYHLGTSRQMIESVSALQNLVLDQTKIGQMGAKAHPDQYLQNSRFEFPLRRDANHTLWVENSTIPSTWELAYDHVLTGIPANNWELDLEPGVCIDVVPVKDLDYCIRCYGFDDLFSGPIGASPTTWFHRPVSTWFAQRGITIDQAGISPDTDIQKARLFPVLASQTLDPHFVEWMYAADPVQSQIFSKMWCNLPRFSAQQIQEEANLHRLYQQRQENLKGVLLPLLKNHRWSVFFKLDLESTAQIFASSGKELPPEISTTQKELEPIKRVHEQMFRAAVLRYSDRPNWETHEARAFGILREMLIHEAQLSPALPIRNVQEDQIVWGRCPVRLDLAGGWSDTPPYCLEHGGRVVNLAVDLNGQPPIQVFAKLSEKPELVMRSIDLGEEQRIRTYDELDTFDQPGNAFALPKAALALAGFLPRFHATGGFGSLEEQLKNFGGGIEVSLLSAVPKGSGLGTSSIMAATLLATIGELCGLNWDKNVLFSRTLAMEQMLTTGGGWQDQAGGIFRGIKLIETSAGLSQKPTLRWMPEHLFGEEYANKTILLYYTGITRLAKSILQEIVRGIFLNSPRHLAIVEDISDNAEFTFNAIQKSEYEGLVKAIQRSWTLNQKLDSGTNPPAVEKIVNCIQDHILACKLLGAGGGGYLLLFAKDSHAAQLIRKKLTDEPPNSKARFVNFSLSNSGLQLTRS